MCMQIPSALVVTNCRLDLNVDEKEVWYEPRYDLKLRPAIDTVMGKT